MKAKIHRPILAVTAFIMLLLFTPPAHAGAGPSRTLTINLTDAHHDGSLLELHRSNLPEQLRITGIGWHGGLTWLPPTDDRDVAIRIGGASSHESGVTVHPAEIFDTPAVCRHTQSEGMMDLADLGAEPFVVTSDELTVELANLNARYEGSAGFWCDDSVLVIRYETLAAGGSGCPADLTGDGKVGVPDLLALIGCWGAVTSPDCEPADLTGSDSVGVPDLLVMINAWGQCPDDPGGQTCEDALTLIIDGDPVQKDNTDFPAGAPACGELDSPDAPVVWFKVEGDGTTLTATSCGSEIVETGLAVFCADCDSPACVGGQGKSENFDCKESPFQAEVSWCSEPGEMYYIAVVGLGSTTEGVVQASVTSDGKDCSDPPSCEVFPCAGHCGGIPPDQDCWCNEACVFFQNCCPKICDACPELSHCEQECPEVVCDNDTGELCGEDVIGGCNMDEPGFGAIECGQTVCGELWAANQLRDTDWFVIDTSQAASPTEIVWTVQADFPSGIGVDVFILEASCEEPLEVIEFATGTCDVEVSACLPPGTYYLVVAPSVTSGMPCNTGPHRYTATVTCLPECTDPPGSCEGWCGQQSPDGCWCDELCIVNLDCCDDVCDHCNCQHCGGDGC